MVKARNEGKDLHEGPEGLEGGRALVPPLAQALDTWKDVSFNYTSTDAPGFTPTVTPA